MYCLGVETSCDETAIALLEKSDDGSYIILNEEISSQARLHEKYGGVVPELASREHLKNLPLLTDLVLSSAKKSLADIALIAVTSGPGLKGCLLTGTNFARGLALKHNTPIIGVNHIEAHIVSPLLENPQIGFPFLALVISGGHTEIIKVTALGEYELISRTLDDAAGEAFDKAANLLGIAYPGGPRLAEFADRVTTSRFSLPKVMRESPGFSFSGLKTAIMILIRDNEKLISDDEGVVFEIAHAAQDAILDALLYKLKEAARATGISRVAVSGGVSANKELRRRLNADRSLEVFYPAARHSTDNAAMIAYLGLRLYTERGVRDETLPVRARWPVEESR